MFPKSHGMKLFNPDARRPTATPAARPMIDCLVRRDRPRSHRIRCSLLSQADTFVRCGRAETTSRAQAQVHDHVGVQDPDANAPSSNQAPHVKRGSSQHLRPDID